MRQLRRLFRRRLQGLYAGERETEYGRIMGGRSSLKEYAFLAGCGQHRTALDVCNDAENNRKPLKTMFLEVGGVGRSPTHSPFAFRRKVKGEVFRDAQS